MSNRQKVNILLVDDQPAKLLALETILSGLNENLIRAGSAEEALRLLLAHDIAVVLVDVCMPGMDGFELAELMRGSERTRRIPIIFVTAGSRDAERTFRGYEAGAVDFLFKPLDTRILKHKVGVLLELYMQRAKLEETLRLNEELLAIVTHDLRSPLASLLMVADVLTHQNEDENVLKHAGRIRRISKQLLSIVNELLDLSRARLAGGIPVERRDMDLGQLAARVVSDFETIHPNRTLKLETTGSLAGRWDAPRVEQVLTNLVGNALMHGDESSVVDVKMFDLDDAVEVSVRNEGAISANALPYIFEPFRRAPGARKNTGLGLGLYIVEQIVIAHGGHVKVCSNDADGTTFSLYLPKRTGTTNREMQAYEG